MVSSMHVPQFLILPMMYNTSTKYEWNKSSHCFDGDLPSAVKNSDFVLILGYLSMKSA